MKQKGQSRDQVRPAEEHGNGDLSVAAQTSDATVNLVDRQALLIKLSVEVAQVRETWKVLQVLVDGARDILGCERARLFLKANDGETFVFCEAPTSKEKLGVLQTAPKPSEEDGVIGCVCACGKTLAIPDGVEATVSDDLKSWGKADSLKLHPDTKSFICKPWKDAQGNILGILEACNKKSDPRAQTDSAPLFTSDDQYMITVLLSMAVRQRLTENFKHCKEELHTSRQSLKFDSLLAIVSASMTASKPKDLRPLIRTILLEAKSLLECDRCALFAVDLLKKTELVGYELSQSDSELHEKRVDMEGLTGSVAKSGKTLNIPDAWKDEHFQRDSDIEAGYRSRSMLIAPLATAKGRVVAVMSCTNKLDGTAFSQHDEKELTAISSLVCDVLQRILLDNNLLAFFEESNDIDGDLKDMLGNFVDCSVSVAVVDGLPISVERSTSRTLTGSTVDSARVVADMRKWDLDSSLMTKHSLDPLRITACLDSLGLMSELKISAPSIEVVINDFESRYSKTTYYHNWAHAFATFHTTFALMSSDVVPVGTLSPYDELALLLASLGHDVEHPGMNNQFLINNRDTLAIRYNDMSVLENHHASVSCVLLEEFSKEHLSSNYVTRFRKVVVNSILGTDMARHHEQLSWMETTQVDVFGATQEPLDAECSLKLSSVVLHCADLAHPTMPWNTHVQMSLLCAQEFYAQFQEEQRLELPSLPFMGKDPTNLVGLAPTQVGFVKFVAAPLWSALHHLIPGTAMLERVLETVSSNENTWQQIADGVLTVSDQGEILGEATGGSQNPDKTINV